MSWERQRESVGAQAVYRHIAIESSETEGAIFGSLRLQEGR
jgi:hypothetical protein